MSVYSTPALRVGVYRCPPGDALWHETNDNIGERPHVVFPGTAVGLVRDGRRVTATPNDVVFYRPFETYERSLRDARGDISLFIAPQELDVPDAPLGRADARSFLLARRLASRLHERDALFVEETAAELIERAIGGPVPTSGRRAATRRDRAGAGRGGQGPPARPPRRAALAQRAGGRAARLPVPPDARVPRAHRPHADGVPARPAAARGGRRAWASESLSRLAADLGYCTPSHFSDRFRGAFGMPPSQLRNFMEAEALAGS